MQRKLTRSNGWRLAKLGLSAAIVPFLVPWLEGCSRNVGTTEATTAAPPAQAAPVPLQVQAAPTTAAQAAATPKQAASLPAKTSGAKLTKIQWEPGFDAALKKAKAAGKPIMVDFFATWCGPCHMLDEQTYPAPPVIAAAADFVNVKVDVDKRQDLKQRYRVASLPTILWLDADGKELDRFEGFGLSPDQFADYMRAAHSKFMPPAV